VVDLDLGVLDAEEAEPDEVLARVRAFLAEP
jgi:hypothetical protein